MKFKNIRVVKFIDSESIIFEQQNYNLYTSNNGISIENSSIAELFIDSGDCVEIRIMDYKLDYISGDHMRFTGYLSFNYKKFKQGTKVNIYLWV